MAKNHGNSVKNDKQYEGLRKEIRRGLLQQPRPDHVNALAPAG
jgi:hypothetical protein